MLSQEMSSYLPERLPLGQLVLLSPFYSCTKIMVDLTAIFVLILLRQQLLFIKIFYFYLFLNYQHLQLFIYLFGLCWVFVSVRGLPLAAASGGHSSSPCAGLSLSWPLLLRSTGSRPAGSVVVAHGPSCSTVCGIFPDQGSNLCLLHQQTDSQPLCHQGSPLFIYLFFNLFGCTLRHVGSQCLDQGSCPLRWKHGVLTTGPPGESQTVASSSNPLVLMRMI